MAVRALVWLVRVAWSACHARSGARAAVRERIVFPQAEEGVARKTCALYWTREHTTSESEA